MRYSHRSLGEKYGFVTSLNLRFFVQEDVKSTPQIFYGFCRILCAPTGSQSVFADGNPFARKCYCFLRCAVRTKDFATRADNRCGVRRGGPQFNFSVLLISLHFWPDLVIICRSLWNFSGFSVIWWSNVKMSTVEFLAGATSVIHVFACIIPLRLIRIHLIALYVHAVHRHPSFPYLWPAVLNIMKWRNEPSLCREILFLIFRHIGRDLVVSWTSKCRSTINKRCCCIWNSASVYVFVSCTLMCKCRLLS